MKDRRREAHEAIVDGLVDRSRSLLRALDRQDRLETAQEFVGWLASERQHGRLAETGREVLLRALKVTADPINMQILMRLDTIEAVELPALMAATGLRRVAASERVHDLVQAGLAVREMIGDQIRRTDLAEGLLGLVDEIAVRAGERLAEELAPQGEMERTSSG